MIVYLNSCWLMLGEIIQNSNSKMFDKILVYFYNLVHAISCPLLLFATVPE